MWICEQCLQKFTGNNKLEVARVPPDLGGHHSRGRLQVFCKPVSKHHHSLDPRLGRPPEGDRGWGKHTRSINGFAWASPTRHCSSGSSSIFSSLSPGLLAPGQRSWLNLYTGRSLRFLHNHGNCPRSVDSTDHTLGSVCSLLLNPVVQTLKKILCDFK